MPPKRRASQDFSEIHLYFLVRIGVKINLFKIIKLYSSFHFIGYLVELRFRFKLKLNLVIDLQIKKEKKRF